MKRTLFTLAMLTAGLWAPSTAVRTQAPSAQAVAPRFHHLHYNSTNPAAAVAAYLKVFPSSTEKATLAGFDGIRNGTLYLLFTKVIEGPSHEAIELSRRSSSSIWN